MKILGVRIDNLSQEEVLERVAGFLDKPRFHQIATINPEFILEAQKNKEFKNILNSCDLNVADGAGIKLAFWRHKKNLKCRITGIDLMQEILAMASDRGLDVFLIANKGGLSTWEETCEAILKIYPDLRIDGENIDIKDFVIASVAKQSPRSFVPLSGTQDDKKNIGSDVLFVNFGAPFQELFINQIKCDNIRLAMGVGGSFDFLTGKVCRAPKFLRFLGLEWLWRVIQQPRRWKRIFRAVAIFVVKVIFIKEEK